MPVDESAIEDLHRCLGDARKARRRTGEVSHRPANRIEEGDWASAVWRSPELAKAANTFANHPDLRAINDVPGLSVHATGRVVRARLSRALHGTPCSFPTLKSKGSEGQMVIRSKPDEYWVPKKRDDNRRGLNAGSYSEADKILEKAGYLLMTAGQRSSTSPSPAARPPKNTWAMRGSG